MNDSPGTIEAGRLYLATEARERLRIGMPTWREMVREGLPIVRKGRNVYVLGDDLLQHFSACRERVSSEATK